MTGKRKRMYGWTSGSKPTAANRRTGKVQDKRLTRSYIYTKTNAVPDLEQLKLRAKLGKVFLTQWWYHHRHLGFP